MSPTEFIAEYLFDRTPQIFVEDRKAYVEWKYKLGGLIEVDPACITFVGSSAIGISLNSSKGFKAFDGNSDVDVAVISHYHFTVAWRFLRSNGHRRTRVDARTRTAWDEHVTRFIYWGTIATDRLLGILPFGKQWLRAIGAMTGCVPTLGREINLRIYTDHESLRAYQILSALRAREGMLSGV